jgi:hypothetical protein
MIAAPELIVTVAQPWADLYSSSAMVATAVQFLHLGGLLVAGGFALSFDRSALRASTRPAAERLSFIRELRAVHRPVMLAMFLVVASGTALLLADVEALLPSGVFWLKMGMFVLLLANGLMIRRTGARLSGNANDVRGWRALRSGSTRSIALWILTVFLGVLLTSAA